MPRIKTILAQSSPWSNTVTLSASHTHTHKSVDLVCMIQTDSLVTGMLVRQPTGHSNRVRKSCPHTLFRALRCPTLSTSQISPVAAPSSHPASLVGQTLTGCRCSTTGSRIVEEIFAGCSSQVTVSIRLVDRATNSRHKGTRMLHSAQVGRAGIASKTITLVRPIQAKPSYLPEVLNNSSTLSSR